MAEGDLDTGLLLKILAKLGELRGQRTSAYPINTGDLLVTDVLIFAGEVRMRATGNTWDQIEANNEIERHLDYLAVDGFITTDPEMGLYRQIHLTAKGQKFVQPELAEFGQEPMMPQVVKSLENRILTYPEQSEKERMLYSLREAIAKNAPDFITDVLVKISGKLITG